MTWRPYGPDRWIGSITLTATTRTLVMSEAGGAPFTVNITAGIYWLYDGAAVGGYPPFFAALLAAIHAANGANVYGVRPITSPISPAPWAGWELYRVSGTDTFSLRLDSGSWTLDRRVLGFAADDTAQADSDGSARIQSRRCAWGQWVPLDIAADKRADSLTEGYSASSAGRPTSVFVWASDTQRRFEYQRLPAANLRRSRAAELAEYATRASKAFGDTHGTWQDLWEQAAGGGVLLIRHNDGAQNLTLDGSSWEAVQLATQEQRASFEATLAEAARMGETYNAVPTCLVLDGTYEHT
jgi:hypothetical protein